MNNAAAFRLRLALFLFLFAPLSAFSQLTFHNETSHPIWIAVAFWNGSSWESHGWFEAPAGGSVTPVSGALTNSYYYYYAEGADKDYVRWTGDHSFLAHPSNRFGLAYADNEDMQDDYELEWYKFRELDIGLSLWYNQSLTANNRCASGDCQNGYGSYHWYDASKYYTGYFRNGKRHGQGTCVYGKYHPYAGGSYEGEWENDRYKYGVFTYSDGSWYEGEWVNDKRHGTGTLYSAGGVVMSSGQWIDGDFVGSVGTSPEVSWKKPSGNTQTTGASYSVEICVESAVPVTAWEIYVNGQVAASTRAPEVVPNDGCDMMIRRSLPLSNGRNEVYARVTNQYGTSTSSTIIIERKDNTPPPPNVEVVGNTKRLALLIGNGDYEKCTALRNPANDVRALEPVLKSLGFDVLRQENLDKDDMTRAIQDFGNKLRNYEMGLVFYSGHGVQVKGRNFLIPVDAALIYEADTPFECVDAGSILAKMEGAQSKVNILILDACRNNPFEKSWNRTLDENGLASMNAPAGTLVAYATSPGMTASDGSGQNGLYTSQLLQALQVPNLKIEEVFKQVRVGVVKDSGGAQVPWESSSLMGDVILFKK